MLVNNAFAVPERIDPRIPFWETPISDWDVMIDVGTRSAYVATHHAAQAMVHAEHGLIVNVSSAGAVRFFHNLVYGIGKAALDRLTKGCGAPARGAWCGDGVGMALSRSNQAGAAHVGS